MNRTIGCFLLLVGLAATAGCDAVEQIASGPKDVTIQVNAPLHVKVREEFVVEVRVQNTASRAQRLDSIDVGDRYLQGVAIQSTEPAFKQSLPCRWSTCRATSTGSPSRRAGSWWSSSTPWR